MPVSDYQKFSGTLTPLPDHILVIDMERGETVSAGGIIKLDDNGKDGGVRPRWCRVYKVGKNVKSVKEGEWLLVEHGRWTWGFDFHDEELNQRLYVQRVDDKGIIGAQDNKPF